MRSACAKFVPDTLGSMEVRASQYRAGQIRLQTDSIPPASRPLENCFAQVETAEVESVQRQTAQIAPCEAALTATISFTRSPSGLFVRDGASASVIFLISIDVARPRRSSALGCRAAAAASCWPARGLFVKAPAPPFRFFLLPLRPPRSSSFLFGFQLLVLQFPTRLRVIQEEPVVLHVTRRLLGHWLGGNQQVRDSSSCALPTGLWPRQTSTSRSASMSTQTVSRLHGNFAQLLVQGHLFVQKGSARAIPEDGRGTSAASGAGSRPQTPLLASRYPSICWSSGAALKKPQSKLRGYPGQRSFR